MSCDRTRKRATAAATVLALGLAAGPATAAPIPIVNPSFELDDETFNEFYFGDPTGWTLIDNFNVVGGGAGTDVQGTLEVTGSPYFGGVAPDGDNVAILFIGGDVGQGEVGLGQVLSTNLAANTHYTLSVGVGNIESGPTESGEFFDLRGFPGYRIELLAGGVMLDQVGDGIAAPIGEGEFQTVTLEFETGAVHDQLGSLLEIRLFNLNLVDPGIPDDGPPAVDLEVDFDNVQLDASPAVVVPLPAGFGLLAAGIVGLVVTSRTRPASR